MAESYLVTGATGFLGSHLVARLLNEGKSVVVLKRKRSDLRRLTSVQDKLVFYDLEEANLADVFARHDFKGVLHCATDYGRKNTLPLQLLEANLLLPLELLELAARAGVSLFINTDTILDKGVSHYSLSKKQFLDWLKNYSGELRCVNVALEHFYGPGDDETKFVSDMMKRIMHGEKIALTAGEQKRDFIYFEDVVEAFSAIWSHLKDEGKGFSHFEVGSGVSTRIRELLELIVKLSGNKSAHLDFGVLPYRVNEVMSSQVNLEGLLALGWVPRVSLEHGLKAMFEQVRLEKEIK